MTFPIPAQRKIDPATVVGWGVDADPENDPTYPYRQRSNGVDGAMSWERPAQQAASVEILRSVEYNRLPAVMGTAQPPRGVSGAMRRQAFQYSESNWWHWLMLLAADRVDVVEGLAEDLAGGRFPNIPAEMGIRAAWQHDRVRLVQKSATVVAVAAVAILAWRHRRQRQAGRHRPAAANRGLAGPPRQAGG